jgi:hypothetical protein
VVTAGVTWMLRQGWLLQQHAVEYGEPWSAVALMHLYVYSVL